MTDYVGVVWAAGVMWAGVNVLVWCDCAGVVWAAGVMWVSVTVLV